MEKLSGFIGRKCWSIIAGAPSGSVVSLKLGNLVERKTPVNNPKLSELDRKYDSDFGIMIWCPWSLFENEQLLCDSDSSNLEGGLMLQGLEKIKDRKLVSIESSEPEKHLTIRFDGNVVFHLYPTTEYENISFFLPGDAVITLDENIKWIEGM